MNRTTAIEWTQHTWNPFVGCSIESSGCKNCYAMRQAFRVEQFGTPHYQGVTKKINNHIVWSGKINRASDRQFNKPKSIKKKSLIFVNSMSDFFHSSASYDDMIEAIEIMRNTDHYFQVLTKRPKNIIKFLNDTGVIVPDNMWIGVTVESFTTKDRIDILRIIDCKTKFVSFEPLINCCGDINLSGIDWAITGGESGFKNRRLDVNWVRNIKRQTDKYNVPHFFKQWGHHENNPLLETYKGSSRKKYIESVDPIGKGGSLLDGSHYKNMPIVYIE